MQKMIVLWVVLLLASCQQTAMPSKQQLDFAGAPYLLNVTVINTIEDYQSSKRSPHVELLSDIPPAQAIKQWVASKLVAGGKTGYAEVVIKDAHIILHAIPKQKTGLEGYFTNEQTEQYDGMAEVEIKIYDGIRTLPAASIHVSVQNTQTLPENATIVDRKNLYHAMSVELMQLLEKELKKNIETHLSNYVM